MMVATVVEIAQLAVQLAVDLVTVKTVNLTSLTTGLSAVIQRGMSLVLTVQL